MKKRTRILISLSYWAAIFLGFGGLVWGLVLNESTPPTAQEVFLEYLGTDVPDSVDSFVAGRFWSFHSRTVYFMFDIEPCDADRILDFSNPHWRNLQRAWQKHGVFVRQDRMPLMSSPGYTPKGWKRRHFERSRGREIQVVSNDQHSRIYVYVKLP